MNKDNHPSDTAKNLKGKRGLRRLVNATKYSLKGFKTAFRNEAAFREELDLAVILIPIALMLRVSAVETLLLIGSILLLMLVEILNSAIEAVVDRIGPELHPLSGRAKDMASAAVFIALLIFALTWGLLAVPVLYSVLIGIFV